MDLYKVFYALISIKFLQLLLTILDIKLFCTLKIHLIIESALLMCTNKMRIENKII